jgi:hypothetical protein
VLEQTGIGKDTGASTDDCSCCASPDSYADPPACTLIIFLFTAQLQLARQFLACKQYIPMRRVMLHLAGTFVCLMLKGIGVLLAKPVSSRT